jgi:Ca2+-dependent lipid-binding protein
MMRTACLLLAVGLTLSGLQAEIHRKGDTVVGKMAQASGHAATATGNGVKAGAEKSGEAVSGGAKAAVHGTATGAKAAGKGVVSGAKGIVHATGKGLEKTGGALSKAGQ